MQLLYPNNITWNIEGYWILEQVSQCTYGILIFAGTNFAKRNSYLGQKQRIALQTFKGKATKVVTHHRIREVSNAINVLKNIWHNRSVILFSKAKMLQRGFLSLDCIKSDLEKVI